MTAIEDLKTEEAVENFLSAETPGDSHLKVIHFKSDWSNPCKEMTGILVELKNDQGNSGVAFAEVNAESLPATSMKYKILAVPTVLLLTTGGNEVGRIEGLRKTALVDAIKSNISKSENGVRTVEPKPVTVTKEPRKEGSLEDRLKALVVKHDVMVFMKGNPDVPRCGFSRTLMGILKDTGIPFETFDILEDEEVRQGLKTFSNWQTYPQVYVKGELIGGLDIVKELVESNELISTLKGES